MTNNLRTTIHGILIPDAWDDRGNVVALAVFTFREEKIRIIDDPLGSELMPHIRKRVTVDGEMTVHDAAPSIRVRHYRIE